MEEAQADQEAARFPVAEPNHTLGLHYLLALERLNSPIEPFTVQRKGAGYHDDTVTSNIASATAIRKLLLLESNRTDAVEALIPKTSLQVLTDELAAGRAPLSWDNYFSPLLHNILTSTPASLETIHEVTEGLEHRIFSKLPELTELSFNSLIESLKTKRYTRTKLQRTFLSILLQLQTRDYLRSLYTQVRTIFVCSDLHPKDSACSLRCAKGHRFPFC